MKIFRRKPIYRMVTFWLCILLVLYAFVGFVMVPHYLKTQLVKQLHDQMGWQVSVGDVAVDPFSLSLTVNNFSALDSQGKRVVSFKRDYVNLSFWSLWRGVFQLQQVELDQPYIRVDLLQQYGLNFIRDWDNQHPHPAPQSKSGSGGLPLVLSRVLVKSGHVQLRDFSQGKPATFDFQPVNIDVSDLATFTSHSGQGQYQLSAQMADNQSISWSGKLSLLPFSLQGNLRLNHLDRKLLWHFAADHVPYQLQAGTLSLNTQLQMDDQDHFQITTSQGSVHLSDVKLALGQDKPVAAQVAKLNLDGIHFSYPQPDLNIGQITGQGLNLELVREASGQFNLLEPLASAGTEKTDPPSAPAQASGPGLTWSIQHLGLTGALVHWQDKTLAQPASVQLHDIQLDADGLSDKLDQPLHYSLKLNVGKQGQISSDGELTPTPLTVHSQFSISQLSVAPAQSYLRQYIELNLPQGNLSADGKIDLDNQNQQLTGTISASLNVDNLQTQVASDNSDLASWKSLKVGGIDVNLQPLVVNVGNVNLDGPQVNISRHADGSTNLSDLLRAQQQVSAKQDGGKDPGKQQGKLPVVRVDRVTISHGAAHFDDHAINPHFSTKLHDLSGSITGLSTVTPQKAKVKLSGRVDGYGKLNVSGDIGTLGQRTDADIKINLDNLALPPLSPYFGRYLGYRISRGKLDAKVGYQLKGTRLDAHNHLIIDQLQLGQSVNSPDAIKAPVRLGLALLKDNDQRITLNVPVKGDLSDPSFNTTGLVFHSFINLIAKAATSPFSVLGSLTDLTGLTGEQLSQVAFKPGQASLAAHQSDKLKALSQALKKRPSLILNIHAETAPKVDGPALKRDAVEQRLAHKLGKSPSLADRIKALTLMAQKQLSPSQLKALQQKHPNSQDTQQWAQALLGAIAEKSSLPDGALAKLANQRANKLQNGLVKQWGVPAKQLFLLAPDRNASVKNGQVLLTFGLDSR